MIKKKKKSRKVDGGVFDWIAYAHHRLPSSPPRRWLHNPQSMWKQQNEADTLLYIMMKTARK